jgi:type I restriction enzyme, S subunit
LRQTLKLGAGCGNSACPELSGGQGVTLVPTGIKINKLRFPVPPTKAEQEAIAEALSDADALIESLEQLTTKKRQIKQGAMQELLSPKDGWIEMCIADVAYCLDNLRMPLNDFQRTKMQGDYPYCGANGILDYIDDYCINDSVILIAEDGGYFDEYMTRPIAYRMSGKFWVNNHAHILKSKPEFDQGFLYYLLVNKNILRFLASGTRAKLNKSELNKIVISIPISKLEQTALATILYDMDDEIELLEVKLEKMHQLKQGMMHNLLTGKIRLV